MPRTSKTGYAYVQSITSHRPSFERRDFLFSIGGSTTPAVQTLSYLTSSQGCRHNSVQVKQDFLGNKLSKPHKTFSLCSLCVRNAGAVLCPFGARRATYFNQFRIGRPHVQELRSFETFVINFRMARLEGALGFARNVLTAMKCPQLGFMHKGRAAKVRQHASDPTSCN